MTTFDLVVVGVVVFGALWGIKAGLLKQTIRLAAWAAAALVPYFLAAPLAHRLMKPLGVPFTVSYFFTGLSLALLSYTSVAVLLWSLTRGAKEKTEDTGSPSWLFNRAGGGLVGATKTAALVWVALSALVVAAVPLAHPSADSLLSRAAFLKLARRDNFWELVYRRRVDELQQTLGRIGRLKPGKSADAALRALANDPRIAAIRADPKLKTALAHHDFVTLLRSPQVLSLLTDSAVLEQLAKEASAAAAPEKKVAETGGAKP